MNAVEQRTHRTVTQSLEQRIETLETIAAQLGMNCEWLKQQQDVLKGRYGHVIEKLGTLEQELNAAKANSKAAWECIARFEYMPFTARFRWLFLGR